MNQKLLFILGGLFTAATAATYMLPEFTNGRASENEIRPFLFSFGIAAVTTLIGAFTRKKSE